VVDAEDRETAVTWERTGRTVRWQGLEDMVFFVVRNSENESDERVEVAPSAIQDDPSLVHVLGGDRKPEGDYYLVPTGTWNRKVSFSGRLKNW
jgi:hypothetical protein